MSKKNGEDIVCKRCRKLFHVKASQLRKSRRFFCSKFCQNKPAETMICQKCQQPFSTVAWPCRPRKYCSRKCSDTMRAGANNARWKGGPNHHICHLCGKPFTRPHAVKNGRFCSTSCKSIFTVRRTKLRRTKPELAFKRWLDCVGAEYKEQHPIPKVGVADFYIPAANLAIEVDGAWWHSMPQNASNDRRKNAAYVRQGINAERIPDWALI